MKFGVRQIANVVFKAKNAQKIGPYNFVAGQPVFYLDTAKTSTLEGAATTVYATGGRGNTRLIAWEGQKTLTFTVEDALLSPISFAMLSGAGLIKTDSTDNSVIHFHQTTNAVFGTDGILDLTDALETDETIDKSAPLYIMKLDDYGDLTGEIITGATVDNQTGKKITKSGATGAVRRQSDGKDLPANLTFPNAKIQSNFTFSMAATGDPSTFSFTMDVFPGYTYFNRTKKVLCAIQVVDDVTEATETATTVFPHPAGYINESSADSVTGTSTGDQTDTVSG